MFYVDFLQKLATLIDAFKIKQEVVISQTIGLHRSNLKEKYNGFQKVH